METMKQKMGLVALLFVLVLGCSLSVSAAVITPREISATATTATVTWTPVSGASFYLIKYGKDQVHYTDVQTTTNRYTFTNLEPDVLYYYGVVAFDLTGKAISTIPSTPLKLYALPVALKKFSCYGWSATSGYFKIEDTNKVLNGAEWQIWNSKGTKMIASGRTTLTTFTANIKRNQTYILKLRSYVSSAYAETLYSPWTSKVIVPEPVQKKPVLAPGYSNAMKISWTKVKGATKYLVYASTSSSSGFKKVASLGKNKSSFVFKKFKGKSLQKYKTYYFKVYAVKGKVKSTANNYTYAYIYTTYR